MTIPEYEELARLRMENRQLRSANDHLHKADQPHAWVRQLPDGWHAFVVDIDPTTGRHLIDEPVDSWTAAMAWVAGMARVLK